MDKDLEKNKVILQIIPAMELPFVLRVKPENVNNHTQREPQRELGHQLDFAIIAPGIDELLSIVNDNRLEVLSQLLSSQRGSDNTTSVPVFAACQLYDVSAMHRFQLPRIIVSREWRIPESELDVLVARNDPTVQSLLEIDRVILADVLKDRVRILFIFRRHDIRRRHNGNSPRLHLIKEVPTL